MVIGIIIYLVVFFLFWIAGTFLTRFCLRKWVNKNSGTGKAFAIFTVIYYLIFMGDRHLSSMVFNYYCSDKELVGLHVYERIELPRDMLLPPPKTSKERSKIRSSLLIDEESKLIDEQKFNRLYDYRYLIKTTIFPIGPIFKYEASVRRKVDGTLLGKAVEIRNRHGWLDRFANEGANSGTSCPRYYDNSGSFYNYDRAALIDAIFDQE
ncbi:hypothetical protein HII17_01885 [Thalassotalea sp. M1531]|uniref:Uncharacterized protein n=1 Tax=Thalassotalea algicola TaxID=2716224 RepID=A0A7Y0L996_9GAMM|nr:hypothetical protein [Thalassotalea algicola]NMP30298.1 hypothetical protein [Thalassotalea algicola]